MLLNLTCLPGLPVPHVPSKFHNTHAQAKRDEDLWPGACPPQEHRARPETYKKSPEYAFTQVPKEAGRRKGCRD